MTRYNLIEFITPNLLRVLTPLGVKYTVKSIYLYIYLRLYAVLKYSMKRSNKV